MSGEERTMADTLAMDGRIDDADEAHELALKEVERAEQAEWSWWDAQHEYEARRRVEVRDRSLAGYVMAAALMASLPLEVELPRTNRAWVDGRVTLTWSCWSKREFAKVKGALTDPAYPTWEKGTDYDSPTIEQLRGAVRVKLIAAWGSCTQIDTGKTERQTVREVEQEARYVEVVKDVPVYEKKCPSIEELMNEG